MTGTGNDFIFIDNRKGIIDANNCRELVRKACRHKLSVGADGMVLIENDSEADFKWRFFNADGSEAEMCGNGARCAARFAYFTGIVEKPSMTFRTLAGIIKADVIDKIAKVQMPPPRDLQLNIELDAAGRDFALGYVNTGVPHAVCFMKDEAELEAADVQGWGRALRCHDFFHPAGTNVDFVLVQNDRRMSVRTYERGVEGETLACGTGVTASVLIAAASGFVKSPVEVITRSGETLTIHFQITGDKFKDVFLQGEALVVYEADLWSETI